MRHMFVVAVPRDRSSDAGGRVGLSPNFSANRPPAQRPHRSDPRGSGAYFIHQPQNCSSGHARPDHWQLPPRHMAGGSRTAESRSDVHRSHRRKPRRRWTPDGFGQTGDELPDVEEIRNARREYYSRSPGERARRVDSVRDAPATSRTTIRSERSARPRSSRAANLDEDRDDRGSGSRRRRRRYRDGDDRRDPDYVYARRTTPRETPEVVEEEDEAPGPLPRGSIEVVEIENGSPRLTRYVGTSRLDGPVYSHP